MKFSFNTFNDSAYFGLQTDPRRYGAAAARAGFDLIGLDLPTIAAFCQRGGKVVEIARAFADEGIGCSTVTAAGMYGDGNDVTELTTHAAESAVALGADFLQSNFISSDPHRQLAELEEACRAVESVQPGLVIALEHLPGFGLDNLNASIRLAQSVGYDRARVLVDIWHVSHSIDTWEDVETMPMEALAYLELDDALPLESDDLAAEMTSRRTFPGEGVLEVDRFCRTFADRGFDGMISVEVISEQWRDGDLFEFARRCLSTSRAAWEKATG